MVPYHDNALAWLGVLRPGSIGDNPFGMKRWLPWLVIPLVLSVWVLVTHARGNGLLEDTDTKVLLANIQARHNPLSWFAGDWPLFNHFYRPVSTLAFEFDLWRWGMNGSGFGLTNAAVASVCIWVAFWVGRELTDHAPTVGLATLAFGLAHVRLEWVAAAFGLFWILAWVCLAGFARGPWKLKVVPVALGFLGCVFLASLVPGPLGFASRITGWLPGRTASVMAIFALASVAAYARYERLTAGQKPSPPTPMDLPATKGTVAAQPGKMPWIWVVVSALALALALGSYEQAVVLPGLLTGVAVMFALQGRRVHWVCPVLFWAVLVGYLVLRHQVVPSQVSGYQAQQFRDGPGVFLDLGNYLVPGLTVLPQLQITLETGLFSLLTAAPWLYGALVAGNIASVAGIWHDRRRWLAIGLLLMGFVAFLPMAWLKFFAHYHYFPAVFYCLFLAVLAQIVLRWVAEAVSPPPMAAPARPG